MKNGETNKNANEAGKGKGALAFLLVVLLLGTAILVIEFRQRSKNGQNAKAEPTSSSAPLPAMPLGKPDIASAPKPIVPEPTVSAPAATKQPVVQKSAPKSNIVAPETAPLAQAPAVEHKIVQDSDARDALALVGVDPEAEDYWLDAINDQSLPKSERQDLIDDLNEEGLPDPKHPTKDDLPLLENRIAILEKIAPTLPQELDWKESYDDLVNLVELANGHGKPVN